MGKKVEKETGFWADVRELRELTKLALEAGHGTRALNEAMKEKIRRSAVHPLDPADLKALKGQPEGMKELLSQVPPGGQIKLSAAEYRKLMGQE